MKSEKIIIRVLMLSAVLLLTVGCTDSGDEVETRRETGTVELVPFASNFTDVESMTRATEPTWAPEGYYRYSDLTGVDAMMTSNDNAAIGVFFTKDNTPNPRKFRRNAIQKWIIDEEIGTGDYNLYGFVPYSAVNMNNPNSVISPYGGSYAAGATLTLTGLSSVSNQDLCVVVGAKHGTKANENADPLPVDAEHGGPLTAGDFSCHIGTGESYIFLLFDHLYAALQFRFHVDEDYAKLRKIKLRKLELKAFSDVNCTTPMTKYVRTTVNLQKTNGTSYIVDPVEFTSDGGGDMERVLIFNGEVPVPSETDQYTDKVGFVPKTGIYYMLYSTYDVYDRKDNLVRKGCVAENKINLRARFNKEILERGKMYELKLTIMPTYLYVLSEPDLDNPTAVVD